MKKKQYIVAFGNSTSHRIFSFTFTKIKIILISVLGAGIFCVLLCLLAHGFFSLRMDYRVSGLKKENAVLRHSYTILNTKILEVEQMLQNLEKKNRQIRMAAALPVPENPYGVGGPDFITRAPHLSNPELKYTMTNLIRLEEETLNLRKSMGDLEQLISARITQIAHYPSIRPVRGGWISSSFGNRIDPFTGITEDHPGIDICVKPGTEVCAVAAGIVRVVNNKVITNKGYGKYILIDHGYGYTTLYGHMSKIYIKPGQKVKRWDIIGLSGNTGKSTAPHLHFGVFAEGRPKNPVDFILE